MREATSLQRGSRKRSLKSSHRNRLPQPPSQEKRSSQHSPKPRETGRPSAASRSSQKTAGLPRGPPGLRISTRSMQRVSGGKNTSGRSRKRQRTSSVPHSNPQGFYNKLKSLQSYGEFDHGLGVLGRDLLHLLIFNLKSSKNK